MKKILAVVLAAATVASIGVTAFAADPVPGDELHANGAAGITEPSKLHDTDVVYPGKTVYFDMYDAFYGFRWNGDGTLPDGWSYYELGNLLTNKKLTSVKVKKDEGSKLVKSMSITQDADKHNFFNGANHVDMHLPVLKVVFNDFLTDDEQKVEGKVIVKFKKNVIYDVNLGKFRDLSDEDYAAWLLLQDPRNPVWGNGAPKDFSIEIPFSFWLNNKVVDVEDDTQEAGTGGIIYKPAKNEDNEWTYEDQNNTIATIKFAGDDDQGKAYSKLSTKWDKDYYAEHFEDQDAFLYDFIASPSLAATSRATVELRVPFVDEDGDLTCDEGDIYVYVMEDDGTLTDVTSQWKLTENEDDEYVMTSRGRQLLTYVIAGPLGAAEEVEEVPEEGVPTGIVLSAYATK